MRSFCDFIESSNKLRLLVMRHSGDAKTGYLYRQILEECVQCVKCLVDVQAECMQCMQERGESMESANSFELCTIVTAASGSCSDTALDEDNSLLDSCCTLNTTQRSANFSGSPVAKWPPAPHMYSFFDQLPTETGATGDAELASVYVSRCIAIPRQIESQPLMSGAGDCCPLEELSSLARRTDDWGDGLLVSQFYEPPAFAVEFGQMRLQACFEANAYYSCTLIYAVSPLEFYVRVEDEAWYASANGSSAHSVRTLHCLEHMLAEYYGELTAAERLIPIPGPGEDYNPDMPCLAAMNGALYRALIRFSGFDDVQVFLIDYGMSHLIKQTSVFYLPMPLAHFTPALAYYCTLEDADSRRLDTRAIMQFLEEYTNGSPVRILGTGEKRKTHGHLVSILGREDSPASSC